MRKIALATFLLVGAPTAYACSPTVFFSAKEAFQRAAVVVVARIISSSGGIARVEALEWLKGPRQPEYILHSPTTCEVDFQEGKVYLIIAESTGDDLHLHASAYNHTTEVIAETSGVVSLVRHRAAWWRSPVSRLTPFRLVKRAWRAVRTNAR